MNKEKLARMKQRIRNREEAADRVLREYCSRDGCPCGFRKFQYWAGKKQGPGWQDSIQNQLVESALQLNCFTPLEDFKKAYWLVGAYYCKNCGTTWNYFSHEWRMLAFQKRLLIIDEEDPSKFYEDLIGNNIFATFGREPNDKKSLTLKQWEEFMLAR